ncbi:MAG: hypothetical protein LDL41_06375 [Coleofasciculus sp. S288]|nr:hypothetical protein [Coleofasciculus sp. S288]
MQSYSSSVRQSLPPMQQNCLNQANAVNNTLVGSFVIFLPSCLVLGAVLYKKYCTYRTTVLYQQIQTLEKLWRISPKP